MMELLHRLTAVWGPAGREHKIAGVLHELITPYADEVRTDRFGNLIAVRRGSGKGKRVMLAAHMDTVGGLALNVSEKGLVYLAPVGDLKVHHALGQRVVWGSGAAGVLQHEPADEPKDLDFKKLWCDIGAGTKDETLENVRLGEMCTLVGELQQMGDAVVGPALDNRAGCAVLIKVAEHLIESEHDVIFAFTAQGELGPRGAGTAAYGIDPDMAFVIDVASAGDVPRGPRVEMKLGGGPALKLKDGAYMAHQGLGDLVRKVAGEFAIPLQTEVLPSGSGHNDAQVVSVAGQGVPTAVIDLPGRYRGTGAEMVNLRDLHGAVDLVLKLVGSPLEL